MPNTYTILDEPIGQGRLVVTARHAPDGLWLVTFVRRNSKRKFLDQCAAWLPCGEWDGTRWLPFRSQYVPPDALIKIQDWLREPVAVAS
jgi:hypothetical protein